jgi:hypothetical protein
MKFLKFPAVLAVASCFFINSIANATVKDESELIDAKPHVKVEKKVSKPEAPAQNEKKLSKSRVDDKAKKVKLKVEEKQPENKQVPLKVEAKLETKRKILGSTNQRILCLTDRYKNCVDWFLTPSTKSIEINVGSTIFANGDKI